MKAKFTLACLLISAMMMAQNNPIVLNANTEVPMGFIPKSLSYDGKNRIYTVASEDQIDIYTNLFAYHKSITYKPSQYMQVGITETREITRSYAIQYEAIRQDDPYMIYFDDDNGGHYESDFSSYTTAQISTMLGESLGAEIIVITTDDNQTRFAQKYGPFYKEETFGKKYPNEYFVFVNGQLFQEMCWVYGTQYEYSEWQEQSRETEYEIDDYNTGTFVDMDADNSYHNFNIGYGLPILSQTFFNEDNKYEYLAFNYSTTQYDDWGGNEPINANEPDTIQHHTLNYNKIDGVSIYSEDGSVLASLNFPKPLERCTAYYYIKLDNNYFLAFQNRWEEEMYVYKINRSGSNTSVEQVAAPFRIGAFPNPANRNQTITIQLTGENAGKSATELQVVNLNGQTTSTRTIPAGQQQTTIPAATLAPGMNLINLRQNGQTIGTEKVIVK